MVLALLFIVLHDLLEEVGYGPLLLKQLVAVKVKSDFSEIIQP